MIDDFLDWLNEPTESLSEAVFKAFVVVGGVVMGTIAIMAVSFHLLMGFQ